MNDFTKTKLINNLIDLVSHFYDLKQQQGSPKQVRYLKGFSEGIAYTLVELKALGEEEAKNILKGLGKKRDFVPKKDKPSKQPDTKIPSTHNDVQKPMDTLDIPTIFRKQNQ